MHWRSFWEEIPGHELFEDVLISAEVGLVKPQPEIFRRACEKFGISGLVPVICRAGEDADQLDLMNEVSVQEGEST